MPINNLNDAKASDTLIELRWELFEKARIANFSTVTHNARLRYQPIKLLKILLMKF